jgi:hypothetical protein
VPADVLTEIEIARPRADVAAYAADPDNVTDWYESIERVEEPSGFKRIAAPLMSRAMRRANQKDLRALKRILES